MDRTRTKLGETNFVKEEAVVMHFLLLYPNFNLLNRLIYSKSVSVMLEVRKYL